MVGKTKEVTANTEAEDNTEALARQELSRLVRQLRLMENDKQAYLDESNGAINHQKRRIKALNMEIEQIKSNLQIYHDKFSKDKEIEQENFVKSLADTYKQLEEDYRTQNHIIQQVLKKLDFTQYKIENLKIKVEAKEKRETSIEKLDHKVHIAKRKLETVTSKFDGIVADNADSRRQIDELFQLNTTVTGRCEQLEIEVAKEKAAIDELLDQATAAYDQREEAVAKTNALMERNMKEKKQFTLEMSELTRVIRHEEKLLEFMNTKNKDRLFLETDDERQSRLEQAKEQEQDLAIESYRETFEKLLNDYSPTMTSLIDEYAQLYHNNIRKFAYINTLNTEMETLQADIVKLRDEIRQCSIDTVERNRQKNDIISKKKEFHKQLKLEVDNLTTNVNDVKKLMFEIVQRIGNLFRLTDINGTVPVLELLGAQRDISSQNAILYINILEERVGELFNYKMDKLLAESDQGTPSIRSKSPRPPSSKPGSTTSLRPRIIVTDRINEDGKSDDEFCYDLVDSVNDPLAYQTMRDKVMDASFRSGSSLSDESIASSIFIRN